MLKTLGEISRDGVRSVCREYLASDMVTLSPREIVYTKKEKLDNCTVKFSFKDSSENRISKISASGGNFVDSLYRGCSKKYSKLYPSLSNLVFAGSSIATKKEKEEVTLKVKELSTKEVIEFRNRSDSFIYSGLVVVLEFFQFYINCEKTFRRLKYLVLEAQNRQRTDLVSAYSYKMSTLTRLNNYAALEC